MSKTSMLYLWKSTSVYLSRFRYIEFLIKSAPAFSLAFIAYVALIHPR
ncbi:MULTISPECIES: hypothetical protein [unclassified Rhizobium]|jgi:hypothetical protein|nr:MULTISPECIES: hypothetical protein [unclassified Rhizobium]MBX5155918.1 hypothetical protein [Rhizobium sp. NZLR8]MBX5164248.1 hypothetical protein [Rhizobium sp. NZLR4b]MBX5169800.1 hypothetical protein [Rhizobium sp. NZLR1b]MBX5184354.1 hypothetical protein [Rhizobium sp. NZLR5]MBX5195927.1 hypothetical protein [Rhizobium sp. NZLR10]